ncbi:probable inactive receptor kinase RLK902 [Malania oleifera]|uniref:probable inactive receptor kinase RLK902 n=1 Tax=Malania oleifera TaxID=397392 RepID=UPI0025AEB578|nr:probable inactive receptor kinase RLK902 [Malania oleifera]
METNLIFTLFCFLMSLLPVGKTDLAADRAALLALRSAVGGRSLLWNLSEPTPCPWPGVVCERDRVTELRLPGMGLSGQLPDGVFRNLTRLHTVSLRYNALSGRIPADIASCTDLRNIYLQGNLFPGEIPATFFVLPNLVRLNLAGNKFSGEIPLGLSNLTRLATLYLENNQLTGAIPDLKLSGLVQFNVSSNQLNGSIPSSLARFPATSFAGNSLCGGPLLACSNNGSDNGGKKLSGGAIAGIVVGSVLGLLLILAIVILLCKRKTSAKTRSTDIAPVKPPVEVELPGEKSVGGDSLSSGYSSAVMAASGRGGMSKSSGANSLVFFGNAHKPFDLEDLLRASAEVLGKGTFGTAYKAALEMGITVAVKRLKDVINSEKEFNEKMEVVGTMDHENLVPLRAYYYSTDEKLLVYDYMQMGSLSALLHGNRGAGRTPLNWETRSAIALGAARGITYLHSRSPTTSHGNIKSSNILLTNSYGACVSDFGLAHVAGSASAPNRVSGYRAPEVTDNRKISQKADVYSFGVLLLELLTGKAPTHSLLNEEGVDLPRWVQSVVREEWTSEVFDLELLRYQNVEEEMVQLLQLAVDCTAQYPDNRPSMAEVTRRIEELCQSGLRKEEDPQRDVVNDMDDGSSRQTYSVDSTAPPIAD